MIISQNAQRTLDFMQHVYPNDAYVTNQLSNGMLDLILLGVVNKIKHGSLYHLTLAPMVDQPQPAQPADDNQPFKANDLVYYINAWNHICTATVQKVEGENITILTSAGGILERKASDLRLVTGSYNDDLPFNDLGEPDDEDTKELPVITVDAPKPSLSNLIDAALDPDNTDAYEALKAYDLASVPLWVLNIEYSDLFYLKWQLVDKSPREADRAFAISDLLAAHGAKADF